MTDVIFANSGVKSLARDANPLCGIFPGFHKYNVCHSNQINGSWSYPDFYKKDGQ
jgi:hypothetical protein